jgi:O-antigen/teichoic acid export membrane protein
MLSAMLGMADFARRAAKGASMVFLSSVAVVGLSYVMRLIIARRLGVEEYGLFYAVAALVGVFSVIKDLGMAAAVSKFFAEYLSAGRLYKIKRPYLSILGLQAAVGIAVFLFLFFGADILASGFFRSPMAILVIVVLSLEFIFGFTTLRHALLGLRRMAAYAAAEPARLAIILALIFFLPATAAGVAAAFLLAALVVTFAVAGLVWKVLRPWKLETEPGLTRRMLGFGFLTFATGIIGVVVSSTDVLVLTYFRSLTDVGLYQAALPTSQVLWIFATSVATILLPVVSEMWAGRRKDEIGKGVGLLLRLSFATLMPFALTAVAFPEIILNLLFGSAFVPAAPALQILAVAAIFYTPYSLLSVSLSAIGRPGLTTKTAVVMAALNLAFNLALVPPFGIIGAAIATAVSYLLGAATSMRYFGRFVNLRVGSASFAKILLSGGASLAVIFGLKELLVMDPWTEAIITMGAGVAAYAFLIFLSRAVTSDDVRFVRGLGIPIPSFLQKLAKRLAS